MPRVNVVSQAGCSQSGNRAVPLTVACAHFDTSPAGWDRLSRALPFASGAAFQPEKTAPAGGAAFITRSVWSVLGSAKSMVIPPATCRESGLIASAPQLAAS